MDGLLKKNIIKKNKRKNWNNLNKLKLNANIIQFFTPKIANRQLNNLLNSQKSTIDNLYMDKVKGLVDEEMYKRIYDKTKQRYLIEKL